MGGGLPVLIVGVYIRTAVKAANVHVCSEGILENLSWSLIRARKCSYPSFEKIYDFHMPT